MDAIYSLKELLCKELEEYGKRRDITASTLEVIDKLAHTVKNLDKILESYEEEEYSRRGSSYRGGSSNRDGGNSYEDGMMRGRGRSARRDSRGRYAEDDFADKLREMMDEAPDDQTRMEIQRLVNKMQ